MQATRACQTSIIRSAAPNVPAAFCDANTSSRKIIARSVTSCKVNGHLPATGFRSLGSNGLSISRKSAGQFGSCRKPESHSLRILTRASGDGDKEPKNAGGKRQVEVTYDPQSKIKEFEKSLDLSAMGSGQSSMVLFSPSKINLFLRITAKRPDGYHELASLFHAIDLGDVIKFSVSPSTKRDSLTTNVPGVPVDESNLIIKAFALYRRKTGSNQFYWVHLDKKVPMGAGLGGGSGNAATALWAANELSGRLASEAQLREWAGEIGSDISFFFSSGCAYCTGRGEIVQEVAPPIALSKPFLLVKPPEECPTKDIYKNFVLAEASKEPPEGLLAAIQAAGKVIPATCINDLEPPAFKVVPSLKLLKERLVATTKGRCDAVFMSGSGSTIVVAGTDNVPSFLYDEEGYDQVFIAETHLITRKPGEWFQSTYGGAGYGTGELLGSTPASSAGQGVGTIDELKLPFSFES